MEQVTLFIITSEKCGHCNQMRGDGELSNQNVGQSSGQFKFIISSFKRIKDLSPNLDLRIISIHKNNMTGSFEDIESYSEFVYERGEICQTMYYKQRNLKRIINYSLDRSGNKFPKERTYKGDFFEILNEIAPLNQLRRFMVAFPCFIFMNELNLRISLEGGSGYGLVYGFNVVKEGDVYSVSRTNRPSDSLSIFNLIERINSNPNILNDPDVEPSSPRRSVKEGSSKNEEGTNCANFGFSIHPSTCLRK